MIYDYPVITKKNDNIWCCCLRCHEHNLYKSSLNLYIYVNVCKKNIALALPFVCKEINFVTFLAYFKIELEELQDICPTIYNFAKAETILPLKSETKKLIEELVFIHITPSKTYKTNLEKQENVQGKKRKLLLFSLQRLQNAINSNQIDIIDDIRFKSLLPPGLSCSNLFRQRCSVFVKSISYTLEKHIKKGIHIKLNKLFPDNNNLTAAVHYSFATGNWGANSTVSTSFGITQITNRTNADHLASQMLLVNTPLNRDGKIPAPRRINLSHYGLLCPSETPEGRSTGLINTLAHFAYLNHDVDIDLLMYTLECECLHLPYVEAFTQVFSSSYSVFVCGNYVFNVQAKALYASFYPFFLKLKQTAVIPVTLGIDVFEDTKSVHFFSQCGRLSRPLFINQPNLLSKLNACLAKYPTYHCWHELILQGLVVYVSKEEEIRFVIAPDVYLEGSRNQYTHFEIDPCMYLHGEMGNKIVYSNHNQAPRNIYQTNMGKQAIGCVYTDEHILPNTESKRYYLDCAQYPLVSTRAHRISNIENNLTGVNVIVAIMCYSGYNQEDSLVVNRASLERGLFRTTTLKSQETKDHKSGSIQDVFEAVHTNDNNKKISSNSSYAHVQHDYVPEIGTVINPGDVIIHKVRKSTKKNKSSENDVLETKDCSLTADIVEPCTVSKVTIGNTLVGDHSFVRVDLLSSRQPIQGDKLSSRHGQKGIIGFVEDEINLPRTAEGIVPDVIVNCHAIPSRMTIGQILESVQAKLTLFNGKFMDASGFEKHIELPEITAEIMKKSKGQCNRHGEEYFFCGKTGIRLKQRGYMGCAYYQRLKHFVVDKIHARSTGSVDILTKQPLEGRSKKRRLAFRRNGKRRSYKSRGLIDFTRTHVNLVRCY